MNERSSSAVQKKKTELKQREKQKTRRKRNKKKNKIVSLDERQTVIQHMCPNVVSEKKFLFSVKY